MNELWMADLENIQRALNMVWSSNKRLRRRTWWKDKDMFKKILIAAGTSLSIAAAALAFQSPAHAGDVKFKAHIGNHGGGIHFVKKSFGHHGVKKNFGHHGVKKKAFVHKKFVAPKKKHFVAKHKKPIVKKFVHKPYLLSNHEIRFYLRKKGLYNIHFIDRKHGITKVIANSRKGFVGKYIVNARNARILDRDILRYL